MSSIQELRNWIEVEYKRAKHNSQSGGNSEVYSRYNSSRASTLQGVLDKIDVLVAMELPVKGLAGQSIASQSCDHSIVDRDDSAQCEKCGKDFGCEPEERQ